MAWLGVSGSANAKIGKSHRAATEPSDAERVFVTPCRDLSVFGMGLILSDTNGHAARRFDEIGAGARGGERQTSAFGGNTVLHAPLAYQAARTGITMLYELSSVLSTLRIGALLNTSSGSCDVTAQQELESLVESAGLQLHRPGRAISPDHR